MVQIVRSKASKALSNPANVKVGVLAIGLLSISMIAVFFIYKRELSKKIEEDLDESVHRDKVDKVKQAILSGAIVTNGKIKRALMRECDDCLIECLILYSKEPISPEILHFAIEKNNPRAVQAFLKKGGCLELSHIEGKVSEDILQILIDEVETSHFLDLFDQSVKERRKKEAEWIANCLESQGQLDKISVEKVLDNGWKSMAEKLLDAGASGNESCFLKATEFGWITTLEKLCLIHSPVPQEWLDNALEQETVWADRYSDELCLFLLEKGAKPQNGYLKAQKARRFNWKRVLPYIMPSLSNEEVSELGLQFSELIEYCSDAQLSKIVCQTRAWCFSSFYQEALSNKNKQMGARLISLRVPITEVNDLRQMLRQDWSDLVIAAIENSLCHCEVYLGRLLSLAACRGHEDLAILLIEKGASLQGTGLSSILDHAVQKHLPRLALKLLEMGVAYNIQHDTSRLFEMANRHQWKGVQRWMFETQEPAYLKRKGVRVSDCIHQCSEKQLIKILEVVSPTTEDLETAIKSNLSIEIIDRILISLQEIDTPFMRDFIRARISEFTTTTFKYCILSKYDSQVYDALTRAQFFNFEKFFSAAVWLAKNEKEFLEDSSKWFPMTRAISKHCSKGEELQKILAKFFFEQINDDPELARNGVDFLFEQGLQTFEPGMLAACIEKGWSDLADRVLDFERSSPNDSINGKSALELAREQENIGLILKLLEAGADYDFVSDYNQSGSKSIFHLALGSEEGHEVISYIFNRRVSAQQLKTAKKSILLALKYCSDDAVLRYLNEENFSEETSILSFAVNNRSSIKVIEKLLETHNVNESRYQDKTALGHAYEKEDNDKIIELLQSRGAKITARIMQACKKKGKLNKLKEALRVDPKLIHDELLSWVIANAEENFALEIYQHCSRAIQQSCYRDAVKMGFWQLATNLPMPSDKEPLAQEIVINGTRTTLIAHALNSSDPKAKKLAEALIFSGTPINDQSMQAILSTCTEGLIESLLKSSHVKLAPGALAIVVINKQIDLALKLIKARKASVLERYVLINLQGSDCFDELWDCIPEDITGHEGKVLLAAVLRGKNRFIEKVMEGMNAPNSAIDPQDLDLATALRNAINSDELDIANRMLSSTVAVVDCKRSEIYEQARQLHAAISCLRNEVNKSKDVVDQEDPHAMALAICDRREYGLPCAAPDKKEAYKAALFVKRAFEGSIIHNIEEEYCRKFESPLPVGIEDAAKALGMKNYRKMLYNAFAWKINIHKINLQGENLLQDALRKGLFNLARELLELESTYYETSKVASQFVVDFCLVRDSFRSFETVNDIVAFVESCSDLELSSPPAVELKSLCQSINNGSYLSTSVIDRLYANLTRLFLAEYENCDFINLLIKTFSNIQNNEVTAALARIRGVLPGEEIKSLYSQSFDLKSRHMEVQADAVKKFEKSLLKGSADMPMKITFQKALLDGNKEAAKFLIDEGIIFDYEDFELARAMEDKTIALEMLNSLVGLLENDLCGSITMDFFKQPFVLTCGHTIDYTSEYLQVLNEVELEDECPTCREEFTNVIKSYITGDLIDLFNRAQNYREESNPSRELTLGLLNSFTSVVNKARSDDELKAFVIGNYPKGEEVNMSIYFWLKKEVVFRNFLNLLEDGWSIPKSK